MVKNLSIVFLLLFIGCAPRLSIPAVEEKNTVFLQPRMIFLTLEVEKTATGPSFKIISHKIADGRLKRPLPSDLDVPNHFKLVFRNEREVQIGKIAVEDPLTRSVEVPEPGGTFKRQRLDLEKASFTVRMDYTESIKSIAIYDAENVLISTLKADL